MASSYLGSMAAVMSEAMKPGATALQVMLRAANSRATVFVRPITPAWHTPQHPHNVNQDCPPGNASQAVDEELTVPAFAMLQAVWMQSYRINNGRHCALSQNMAGGNCSQQGVCTQRTLAAL